MIKRLFLLAFLLFAAPVMAQQQQVEAALEAAPKGTRFGLLVVDEQGREVVAIQPDQRFIPASNTKLFTTAAAYAVLDRDSPEPHAGVFASLTKEPRRAPDVVISGGGGVSLSSAADCKRNCLAKLAERIAEKTGTVGNVIADDTNFADQRWSPGMSWNNIVTDSGTAVSALIVDDNELAVVVTPGLEGQPAQVAMSRYFTLRNDAVTVASGTTELSFQRPINSRELRLFGTIPVGAAPWRERLGIDDPAHHAGWAVQQALLARGVKVKGTVQVRRLSRPYEPGRPNDRPVHSRDIWGFPALPLDEEVGIVNKDSQNLHAETLLRRVGRIGAARHLIKRKSDKPILREAGLEVMQAVLETAKIPRHGYDFSDGSGMSTYNRLSPRATIALLRWAATQPWGEAWYASLPVAGVDGTLKRRFIGTPLAGNLTAKTGSLNATSALSGRLRANSGRMLTFAFFANDVPDGTNAVPAMEAALLLLAEAN